MVNRTPVWVYSNSALNLLDYAESILSKYWVIPRTNPGGMFIMHPSEIEFYQYLNDPENYVCICPNSWTYFEVYDKDVAGGIYIGSSLYRAFEVWASDIDRTVLIGIQRSKQGVFSEVLLNSANLRREEVREHIAMLNDSIKG